MRNRVASLVVAEDLPGLVHRLAVLGEHLGQPDDVQPRDVGRAQRHVIERRLVERAGEPSAEHQAAVSDVPLEGAAAAVATRTPPTKRSRAPVDGLAVAVTWVQVCGVTVELQLRTVMLSPVASRSVRMSAPAESRVSV